MARSLSLIVRLAPVAVAAGLGGAVSAADFALPAGCEAYVTIQKHSCFVSHLFRCDADPEGYQRRVDLNKDGMTYLGVIDAQTQWVESFSPGTGNVDKLDSGAADPSSFDELMTSGGDVFDFTVTGSALGQRHIVGEDRLTGKTITVDGVDLSETTYKAQIVNADGSISGFRGIEYVVPEWRTFVSGVRTFTSEGKDTTLDLSPVEFAFPGEAGFLADTPKYDCGATVSKAER